MEADKKGVRAKHPLQAAYEFKKSLHQMSTGDINQQFKALETVLERPLTDLEKEVIRKAVELSQ